MYLSLIRSTSKKNFQKVCSPNCIVTMSHENSQSTSKFNAMENRKPRKNKTPKSPKQQNKPNNRGNNGNGYYAMLYGHPKISDIGKAIEMMKITAGIVKINNSSYKVALKSEDELTVLEDYMKKYKIKGVGNISYNRNTGTSKFYKSHWPQKTVDEKLKSGELYQGCLRIAPKNFQCSFITVRNEEQDILIQSIQARNRALEGDFVALQLLPRSEWLINSKNNEELLSKLKDLHRPIKTQNGFISLKDVPGKLEISDNDLQKTGEVVAIIKEVRRRTTVGILSYPKKPDLQHPVFFTPLANNMPRMFLSVENVPPDFFTRPDDFHNKMYMAKITEWVDQYAVGQLLDGIGNSGEIEPETRRILTEFDVDDCEFPAHVVDSLPGSDTWKITDEEVKKRRDFRNECIFTIDPSTARDLDDALHCKKIGEDLYEVGVHIADVSFFVEKNSPIDKIAAKRCTSVYLVQRVIPMLPRVLCDDLCSLHPGTDRLAFSVVWEMNSKGEIKHEWFGKSVIHSCIKMSYDHAQSFITASEGTSNGEELSSDIFPDISGDWTIEDLGQKVVNLHTISQSLRKQRMDNGALRLDQIKLSYLLNAETGIPDACFKYEYKKSNELIEEFMLLANIAVAHKLKRSIPDSAFLRCHPEPKEDMLLTMAEKCRGLALDIDTSSSAAFSESLIKAAGDDELSEYRLLGLQLLAIKPQQLAIYFCAGCIDDEDNFRHYALNVPLYTHFTSPIRRYADLVVHRQLAKVLGQSDHEDDTLPSAEELKVQADLCNQRKMNSKRAQDASIELYFTALLEQLGTVEGNGIVIQIMDHAFDVLSIEYGFVKRVYCESLQLVGFRQEQSGKYSKNYCLSLLWNNDGTDEYKKEENASAKISPNSPLKQTIDVFSVVRLVLEHNKPKYRSMIKAFIKRSPDGDEEL